MAQGFNTTLGPSELSSINSDGTLTAEVSQIGFNLSYALV